MKVIIVDCHDELLIGSFPIDGEDNARRIDRRWREQETARGHELDRLLVRGGTCEIMNRDVPIPSGKEVSVLKAISS